MKAGKRIEVEVLSEVKIKSHDTNDTFKIKILPAGTWVSVLEDSLMEDSK